MCDTLLRIGKYTYASYYKLPEMHNPHIELHALMKGGTSHILSSGDIMELVFLLMFWASLKTENVFLLAA